MPEGTCGCCPAWAQNPALLPVQQPHHTTHVVWELEGLVASLLPSAGLDERSWGLFTQDFQVQVFVLCLAHFSLAPILAHRRVKVRIDCPVTAGGYCLTGAGANILSI